MVSLLEDLVQHIINAGLAITLGQDIFCDYEPDQPSNIVVLNEYDSKTSSTVNDAGVRYVQVIVRNQQPTQARNKANQIFKIFARPENNFTDLPSGRWCLSKPKNAPIKIRVDEKQRVIYGFNVALTTNFD